MTFKPFRLLVGFLVLANFPVFGQEIGLGLYSLRNEFAKDAPAAMAQVREMGFRQVELSETYGLSFPQLIKLLAQNQLSVLSFGTSYEKLMTDPQAVVDEARSYGARFIVCYWLPHEGTFTPEDADRTSKVLNQAGKVIAQNGLLLCYHPHGYEFSAHQSGTVFDYFMTKLDASVVYLQMDVFWVKQAGQEPVVLLKKYPSRFVMLHLKDRRHGTQDSSNGQADVESNVSLGTGDVGIAEVIQTARELGIQYFFIEDESSRARSQIPLSLAYLKSLAYQTRK
jgi:sugar phosphate isomerase/epimerase